MAQKVSATAFVSFLAERCARKDGYIMGATGQNPKAWAVNSWWFTQYNSAQKTKALEWRKHAERVWDCNGLAEGYYKDITGIDINTRARNNYSTWCSPKGTGSIPNQYKLPGAAVFIHSTSEGAITHVGYLEKPVDAAKPTGDWYVIEAKGVMYGVVRTKLNGRGWNRWGLMTKYFDYEDDTIVPVETELGGRILKIGSMGSDAKNLQEILISLNYSCGKWGADGEFGADTQNALKAFQADHALSITGIYDDKTHAKVMALIKDDPDPVQAKQQDTTQPIHGIQIIGNTVNIRTGPGTNYPSMDIAKAGKVFPEITLNGWYLVDHNGTVGYVSPNMCEKV